jgi:hypothetical protein
MEDAESALVLDGVAFKGAARLKAGGLLVLKARIPSTVESPPPLPRVDMSIDR